MNSSHGAGNMPEYNRELTDIERWVVEQCGQIPVMYGGIDAAIVGIGVRCGQKPVLVYDKQRAIEEFAKHFDGDIGDAQEWYLTNVEGNWVGEQTPMLLERMPSIELAACHDDALEMAKLRMEVALWKARYASLELRNAELRRSLLAADPSRNELDDDGDMV